MKINKIILDNLGLYWGKHEFMLCGDPPGNDRNIVLFGGLNGSGKTTLFEAVKLCLYGKGMFPRISVSGYHDYLFNMIHHSDAMAVQPNYASVGLEFQYSRFGETSVYYIYRKWGTDGGKNIIEDKNNAEFKSSVKMLLGLDLVERLQTDLKIYKSKNLKDISSGKFKKELETLNKEKSSAEGALKKLRDQLAVIENQVLKTGDEISCYREKIRAQGSGYFEREDSLIQERRAHERDLENLKENLRDLAAGPLPLAIAAGWSRKLKVQIEKDQSKDRGHP